MTKAAVQVTNAKLLRPFDQEDKDFFAEFSELALMENLEQIKVTGEWK